MSTKENANDAPIIVNITDDESENTPENIVELVNDVKELLTQMKINSDVTKLSIEKMLKIQSEIQKLIKNSKTLGKELQNIAPTEKVTKIIKITWDVLEHPEINSMLSSEVKEQLRSMNDNKEFVELVMSLLDWTSDKLLDSYDNDDNGAVTVEEVEADTVKCCAPKSCCPCWKSFGRGFAKCWSKFFVKVLCCQCGSDQVVYDNEKYEAAQKK